MRVLITGLCGFIGHHVAEHLLETTDWEIVGLDRLDATSTLHRLHHIKNWPEHAKRVTFVWHDLRAPINTSVHLRIGKVEAALHLAATTHVDRSIAEPISCIQDNVMGTAHLLEWWRTHMFDQKLLHIGTDEVFGPAPEGVFFKEWDRYRSSSPYSASKAGAEELMVAYANTYKLRINVVHVMNVFAERQHPEKFIPMTIRKVLNGETVTVHSNKDCTKSGTRFYVHAENVARALKWILDTDFHEFDKWNIVGEREVSNLEIAEIVARELGKPLHYEFVDAELSRPGHDLRYALDGSKLRDAGFEYKLTLEQGVKRMVDWYLEHPEWLNG